LALFVTTAQAATVRLYFTDPLTNDKDTNAFYITPIGTNVLSNGGVIGRGVTTRYVPASNGYRTNTLAVGHYSITNRSLGSGVVIRVPETSSLYDYTNLLISGYNTFVTINNYTNSNSGAAVSNVFGLTFALNTRYTNSTAYYAQISSSMTFTQQNSSDSAFYFFIDTNLDGTIDFRRTNWFHVNIGTTWSRTTFTETVPPGAAYGATNISNGTSTMAADALGGAIIYFSTNSASGAAQTNISYTAVTNLASFGALTNNDTRNVTFLGTVASSGFQGDGNGLTELDADNLIYGSIPVGRIQDGLITSNKLDATAYVAFKNDVTQSGLAAGSYAIAETALTGLLRFSSTNTAFIDGAATNAITVVSNAYAWLTITLSGANATTRGAARTYYPTANSLVFTNGATNGLYFVGSLAGNLAVTNAAYPDSVGDFSNTALIGTGGTALAIIASGAWNDNESDFNPQTVTMTGTYLYQPSYASFNGKHVGDGSALVNIPAPGAGVVVETNVSFPVSGRVTVGHDFTWKSTNAQPAQLVFNSTAHGASHGIVLLGGNSGDVVLNPGVDDGILQIGVTGNMGNRIYMQYGMYPWASTNTVGVSHPLEFRSRVWNGGAATFKYPGIVGFSEANDSSELGKLVFYARAPLWNSGNLNAAAPNTAGTEVFSAGTNGVVAASGIRFKGDNFTVSTVTITSGSGSPESVVTAPVGSLFLRTDGSTSTTLYVKTSGSGNTGWTAK